jgi:restriction system protein
MQPKPFPKYHELMRPLLAAVADGAPHQLRDLIARMGETSGLSADQLNETIPSGQTKFRNRTFWAATYLRKAQALSTPKRGWVQLAERGKQLLAESGPITEARLRQFPGWDEAWGDSTQSAEDKLPKAALVDNDESTPEEQIASGIEQLEANVRGELLQRVKTISPEAFERLVLQLLGALGYGVGPESRQGVRRGPDGGIDGRIDEDRLGLASIYIQAKRYQEQSVGRPAVQSFYGAMGGQGASKGVFITTSTFTRDASDCAADLKDKKIVLIDGSRLTRLMLDSGVGVSVKDTYRVHRIDEDFFAEFEEA